MHARVAEYRLSLRARADLLDIYAFSEAMFGRYQAEAYHAGFERTFGLLADFPGIGASVDELVAGYRRFRFQSHYIFYTEEPDHVLIRALIHVRQNLRPGLFE
jgi:toxin ParE1/3/4